MNNNTTYSYTPTATLNGVGSVPVIVVSALPDWLSFDNGILSGMPTATSDPPTYNVTLQINGTTVQQSFTIVVNRTPEFVGLPSGDIALNKGVNYSLQLNATDQDASDTVTISISSEPAWMTVSWKTVNNTPGWWLEATPDLASIGQSFTVGLKATDQHGAFKNENLVFNVVNRTPYFETGAPSQTTINVNQLFSYDITAKDDDGEQLTVTATIEGGPWLTFDGSTLSGTPQVLGDAVVTLRVEDGQGAFALLSFTLTVVTVSVPFSYTIEDDWAVMRVSGSYTESLASVIATHSLCGRRP